MTKVRVNWGPLEENCSVKLYEVYNTSHNSLLVLACNESTAMSIAYTANHIYSPYVKIAENYTRKTHEVRDPVAEKLKLIGPRFN